ncbi:MAG: hypothetical protein ACR2IJ_03580 [Fluviibacter sp.]
MNVKPINLETIWNDTYRNREVAGDPTTSLKVFSAIHSTGGPILRIEMATYTNTFDMKCQANLTPEQAESMAAELLLAAKIKREHDIAWANHLAAQLPEAA